VGPELALWISSLCHLMMRMVKRMTKRMPKDLGLLLTLWLPSYPDVNKAEAHATAFRILTLLLTTSSALPSFALVALCNF
jgi:hypothetical protein